MLLSVADRKKKATALPSIALCGYNLGQAIECAGSKWWDGGLHADLDSLERAESNVGEELGRRRGTQVKPCLVLVRILLTSEVGIRLLEVFITTVLECTLGRVSPEGRAAASVDAPNAFGAADLAPCLKVTFV